uniref:Ig-like domain-containing protein n=1 Tax=Anabas testudineus TaxID=64144 RepID=A0A3Q1KAG8_ANATE
MLENENSPSLTITEVNANATYICTASNTVGYITEQIHVYVRRKISPPVVDVTTPVASAPQNGKHPCVHLIGYEICNTCFCDGCTPTLIPPELVVRFGESASINCTSSHPDFDIMGWEAPYGGSRYVKSSIPIISVFLFLPIMFFITETPDSVSVSASSDEPLVEGREFSLTCDIINVAPKRNLIVKWYRDHEKVHTEMFKNDTSELPNNVTSTWKMIPKKSYNGTKFTCKAELDLGPKGPEPVPTATSEPYIAVVHFAPTFKEGNDSKEVNQGENVTFSCHAEGNPAPEIHWNYTSAESVGKRSVTIKIILSLSDFILIENPDMAYLHPVGVMVEGEQHKLQCDIINVAPVQDFTVRWSKDDITIKTTSFTKEDKTPANFSSFLPVSVSREKDEVQYSCEAELDLGPKGPEPVPTATSEPYIAVVHFAPTFKEGNDSKEVNQGENVTFSCHAEGNPAPEIHWNYTSAESVWETSGGRQKNITIKATSTNAGVYICVATNEFGKVTRSVTLKIKGMIFDCVMDTFGRTQ